MDQQLDQAQRQLQFLKRVRQNIEREIVDLTSTRDQLIESIKSAIQVHTQVQLILTEMIKQLQNAENQ